MKVLAIDPGYDRVGFAILEKKERASQEIVHFSSCFTTVRTLAFTERLKAVGEEMERLIETFKPEVCAIEKLFFVTNQKTAMAVSEARARHGIVSPRICCRGTNTPSADCFTGMHL